MADRRGIIVPLLILAFIFLSPDPQRTPAGQIEFRNHIDDVIAEEQRSLSELQNSTYNELGLISKYGPELNLTGLEPDRGYAWEALPQARRRVKEQVEYALGDWSRAALELKDDGGDATPLYQNVSGIVHGKWVRSKVDEGYRAPQLNLTEYAPIGPFGRFPAQDFRRNITGDEGDIRIKFHDRQPSATKPWSESPPGNVTNMDVEMALMDSSTGDEHDLRLLGVYFPTAGHAVLTTTSEKFTGIFMLPHLTLSHRMFEASRTLLNESISRTIQRQIDGATQKYNPWSPAAEGAPEPPFAAPHCELVVYLQQLPPVSTTAVGGSSVLSFLESELRFPTGAFIPLAPELRFSMVAFSPDCGYILESKGPPDYVPQEGEHLLGPKVEVLYNSARHHLLVFTLALALQLVLLMRQMREASTPSTRSRISFYTIAMLALGDGFTTMTFLLISLFIGVLWVNLVGTAFLAFVSVSFFGMRFLMDIWAVQAPERARRAREEAEEEQRREERFQAALARIREERRAATGAVQPAGETNADATDGGNAATTQQADPPPAVATSEAPAAAAETIDPNLQQPPAPEQPPPGSLPLPVTAQRPTDTGATPVFMPSDQEGLDPVTLPNETPQMAAAPTTTTTPIAATGPSFGSLYTRFYLLLLATLFLSLNASSWPSTARRIYFTGVGLLYLSFWLPQIKRNIQRNCRHALNWEFVIGHSVLRLLPFAYFYGYKHNVLFAEADYTSLALLALWLWIQVVVLVSQEIIGPRWFIRKDWAPPAYDYHPVLREDEEGATMPIGFSQATASSAPSSPVLKRRDSDSPIARRGSTAVKEKGKRVFDCAICMQDLEVPIIEAGGASDASLTSGPAGLLARRTYMVTPCRHIFHSACLEGWMKYRLQCPICRETLPPL